MNEYEESRRILQAVKTDDVKTFSTLLQSGNGKAFCYGKLPLLSVCYLYRSNRIVKKYESALLNVKSYVRVAEDAQTERKLKRYRKRCSRVYLPVDSVISPLEVLYLTGNRSQFAHAYAKSSKNDAALKNIARMQKIQTGKELVYRNDVPMIPSAPLNGGVKAIVALTIVLSLLGSILGIGLGIRGLGSDYGSADNPYLVHTARQLEQALAKGQGYYRLEEDIEYAIDRSTAFDGVLNGNGHTLTLKGGKVLFSDLKGTVENVTIDLGEFSGEVSQNTSYFVFINSGVLSDITIKGRLSLAIAADAPNTLYLGTAVGENTGEIRNMTGQLNVVVTGRTNVNTSMGGLVAINSGSIDTIGTTAESTIEATNVDVAGIVGYNNQAGTIRGATNRAAISQSTASDVWSPNVGGIALTNNGTIENARNDGVLSDTSQASGDDTNVPQVIVGGVCAVNHGTIRKSANGGSIVARSASAYIQAGGIAAQSSGGGGIEESYSKGEALAIAQSEKAFVFLGGIVGNNEGKISGCYSISSLTAQSGADSVRYAGGIVGVCNVTAIYAAYLKDNHFLLAENIVYGTGGVGVNTGGSYVISPGLDVEGLYGAQTMQGIFESGVYWE